MLRVLLAVSAMVAPRSAVPAGVHLLRDQDALFPQSSAVDFSFLLDPPAGKHGFLTTDARGRFAWKSGKRMRFWGVNISNRSVFVDPAVIDRVVGVLARSGVNMVRFEALDSEGGVLHTAERKPVTSPDPAKLAILDYWTWRLRERGIYYYFDLLDLRTFGPEDGVPEGPRLGRGARPYAMFDPVLISRQKEYAAALLLHQNPHTGLRYVDDPALALVEICNESGFFLRPETLRSMPERLETVLRARWNAWLVRRYGSRDRLAHAWSGGTAGASALGESEDPLEGSVLLPALDPVPTRREVPGDDAGSSAPRYADGARFLAEVQEAYFREMLEHLRSLGLRVPVTAVTSEQFVGDGIAGMPLDFTAGNYYCDHPAFADGDWQGALHFMDVNPLRETGVRRSAPVMAALRWGRRPVVIREWAQPWPNRYRCVSPAEMVSYGSLQDVDGFLLFSYHIAPRPEVLGDFDFQADPAVWGLMGPAALSYLREDVRPAPFSVTLSYKPGDAWVRPGTVGDAFRLAWNVRVRSVYSEWPGADTWKPSISPGIQPEHVLRSLRSSGLTSGKWEGSVCVSAGGEIARWTDRGVLTVAAPRTVIVAGEIGGRAWSVGPFRFFTHTPVGTFWAVSLDGLPLSRSRRFLVKLVSGASNTGQVVSIAPPGAPARYRLEKSGGAPILTHGAPRKGGTRIVRGSRLLLALDMVGGTWELLVEGDRASLTCDTGGVAACIFGTRVRTVARQTVEGPRRQDDRKSPAKSSSD